MSIYYGDEERLSSLRKYIHIDIRGCDSQEEAVEMINSRGETRIDGLLSSFELAGQYAYIAALDQDDTSKDNLWVHLEIIEEAGAKFHFIRALDFAISLSKDV